MSDKKALDVAAALADSSHLTPFDDRPVNRVTMAVTNAGDGLSAAMAVAPVEYHHGQRVIVVLEGIVSKVAHVEQVPGDADSAMIRQHTIKAEAATILGEKDEGNVRGILNRTKDAVRKAVDAAAGQMRLDGTDADDTQVDGDDGDDL